MSLNLWSTRDTRSGTRTQPIGRARRGHLFAKRAFDIIASIIALICLLPLMLAIAIAVKFSGRGPVLFVQEREGLNGQLFRIFKFRTLYDDCRDPTGLSQPTDNDHRITQLGQAMRRTGLDELPQLLNVLVGDMSLVGPRPHVPAMQAGGMTYRSLVPDYDRRLTMRPGLTGWAQANGLRGPTHDAEMARDRIGHDLAYIENFSFWFDIRIIVLTLRHELLGGS